MRCSGLQTRSNLKNDKRERKQAMSKVAFNKRLLSIESSASIALMDKARSMKAQGIDVISLAGGEPDFNTPEPVESAAIQAMLAGRTHYTTGRGIPALREKIAEKLETENHILCRDVLVTPGCKYAICVALEALLNPGDEVLIPTPSWVSYDAMVRLAGGVPISVPLSFDDEYRISEKLLEKYVSSRTRIIIINTPNNPTGRVLSGEEASILSAFARRHDLFVIADEVYEKIIFDGREHISLGSYPELEGRVIVANGFSKFAAMTGWRVGYIAGPGEVIDMAYRIYQHTMTCISEFSQIAALTALDHPEETERMRRSYLERRDYWYKAMQGIPGVTLRRAEGAFYAWMRIEKDEMNSSEIAAFLLQKAGVVVVPGIAYGENTCSCVRASLATAMPDLIEAAKRIRTALQ